MSGAGSGAVARSHSGSRHFNRLATRWEVRVTGIEFTNDFPMEANGNNRSDVDPDRRRYPTINKDFRGWGRGAPLAGWDWEGSDNLDRAASYQRLAPVAMRVRLRSTVPAPTARSFQLEATPSVDGASGVLTAGVAPVSWPAGQQERIVPIMLGGVLPNEISRYHLRLTWRVSGMTPGGIIAQSNHKIFSLYGDPLDPSPSGPSGTRLSTVTGLTKKRLDKLTTIIGGSRRRCLTQNQAEIDALVWTLHVAANDENPPYFDGARAEHVEAGSPTTQIALLDQWVMWAPTSPHWNVGSCIGHSQLVKTMLASVGINARRAWVLPKTNLMPNGSTIAISPSDLIIHDDYDRSREQSWSFSVGALVYTARVLLVDEPGRGEENYEACLYYEGKLFPGAIPTGRYPRLVRSNRAGFDNALDVLRWWHSVRRRFLAWYAESPTVKWFDRHGVPYNNPHSIPAASRLPLP